MKIYLLYFFLFLQLLFSWGCKESDFIITKDYIINPNWDKHNNFFKIVKMKLKDNNDSINLNNAIDIELKIKFKQDTCFSYFANVDYNGVEYSERKVYFNRYNGFLWWRDLHKSKPSVKVLGELKHNTWYLLSGLSTIKTLYYIYIDSSDSVQIYPVYPSNW